MISKKDKYLKDQKRNARRGLYTRARRIKFLMLKARGDLSQYYAQRAGYQIKFKPSKTTVVKLSLWQKIIRFIKRPFGLKKHDKKLL